MMFQKSSDVGTEKKHAPPLRTCRLMMLRKKMITLRTDDQIKRIKQADQRKKHVTLGIA